MWELLDIDGSLLERFHCQYDVLDFAYEEYNIARLIIDFEKKRAIVEKYRVTGD